MLNLQNLKEAFSDLDQIGKGETTFEINNTTITIRLLLPSEEMDVQKQAGQAYSDNNDTGQAVATAAYLENFKINVLSYAVIAVGDCDLRNEEYVETGEYLKSGVAVKIPKTKAVKDLLSNFSRKVLDGIFQRYTDLSTRIDLQSEELMDYVPIDLEAEVERLEAKLSVLRDRLGQGEDDENSENVKTDESQSSESPIETTPQAKPPPPKEAQVQPPKPQSNTSPPKKRQRISPQTAPPPVEKRTEMSKEEVLETLQSSFVEKDEDGGFPEAALLNEHARLSKIRESRKPTPPPVQRHRKAPH